MNYTINDLGNLTKRQAIPAGGGTGQTIDYFYAGTNGAGRHAVTSSSLYGPYGYDGNGNQTGRPGNETVSYSPEDLPKTISGVLARAATFEYDADGGRVLKTKSSTGDSTVYVGDLYESSRYSASTALTTFTSFTVRRAPWRR